MENYRPQIGTPIDELDTPCLLIDMDALEHNYRTVAETYRNTEVKMRQHAKNIKSPMIAHMQIRTGGTVGGVCTAKVSEAEVMVDGGIDDILVTSQVATRDQTGPPLQPCEAGRNEGGSRRSTKSSRAFRDR